MCWNLTHHRTIRAVRGTGETFIGAETAEAVPSASA